LFQEDNRAAESIQARLVEEGFAVTCARTFLEAAPHLVAGRTHLFLIYLPETEWVRNAILTEVRRANPTMPIVAVAPRVSNELGQVLRRLHVANVLAASSSWKTLVETLHQALVSSEPPTGDAT
jgi:hypothetical protein